MAPSGRSTRRTASRCAAWIVAVVLLLAGCDGGSPSSPTEEDGGATARSAEPASGSESPQTRSSTTQQRLPGVRPGDAQARTAMRAVRRLAGEIGPRPGHTRAYFRAAAWVEGELASYGWQVRRQRFPTPAGVSWGVPVEAGPSVNLVATRGDVRPDRPWLLVGAHLDTVPRSPGAEDNASGVGVLLAVAEALEGRRSRLPVVLVAFGSEEPRGPSDDDHHYGSRAYVRELGPRARRQLRGMVAVDRVGVGRTLPVSSATEPSPVRRQLEQAAAAAGVDIVVQTGQRSSDHWSFVRAGLPGARLGSTPYTAYHSPADTPDVVDPRQLERAARVILAWLA